MDGHQSGTLRDALKNGQLQDLEFVSHEESYPDGLDEDSLIQEVTYEAKWKVGKKVSEEQSNNVFKQAKKFMKDFQANKDHSSLFVRIKTESGQIKRTHVDVNREEILEQAFVQNEIVNNFDKPLPQRYSEFRSDMVEKMIDVYRALVG